MAANNAIVAEVLRRYAALLIMNGEDRFKVKAYQRAAATIETLNADVAKLVASGIDLTNIPTVGKAISRAIREIVETRSMSQLDEILAKTKPELIELDLSDEHARLAKEAGIQIAINTDAHSIAELNFMEGGINQARRAWLEPRDVLNALPLEKLMARFRR